MEEIKSNYEEGDLLEYNNELFYIIAVYRNISLEYERIRTRLATIKKKDNITRYCVLEEEDFEKMKYLGKSKCKINDLFERVENA